MEAQKQTALLASRTALQERINSIEYRLETRFTHQVHHIDIMTIATDRHQQKTIQQESTNLPSVVYKVARMLSKSITRLEKIIHGAKHSNQDM